MCQACGPKGITLTSMRHIAAVVCRCRWICGLNFTNFMQLCTRCHYIHKLSVAFRTLPPHYRIIRCILNIFACASNFTNGHAPKLSIPFLVALLDEHLCCTNMIVCPRILLIQLLLSSQNAQNTYAHATHARMYTYRMHL